jgi:hypothetical protein
MNLPTTSPSLRAGLLLVLAAATAPAQSPVNTDVERGDMMTTLTRQLTSPETGTIPSSPADPDLGDQRILVPDDRYKSFTLFSNVSEFYTTNATLSNGGGPSDWFTALQFGAAWVPRLSGNLFGEATALQQLFRYADLSGLSFNSLDLGAGLIYVVRELDDLSVFARYNYNLLTNPSSDGSLFYQQTIRLGLNKPFVFSRAHSANIGLVADLNLDGWPGYALRNRFALLAGYQVNLTRLLQANLFYQIGYFPFAETARRDWNQLVSLGFSLNINPRFSINTSVSGGFNSSNDSFYSYSVLNTGAGVSVNYRF